MSADAPTYTVFAGHRCIASGELRTVLLRTKEHVAAAKEPATVLVFEDQTGRQVDVDFRASVDELLARAAPARPGPGRPRLGVVSREVSLLPRHWEWLEQQPQGISAALRRLVDEARKRAPAAERARLAREAASKVMWSIAGDFPGFEEATRALFGREERLFASLIKKWPADVRDHVKRLAAPSFLDDDAAEATP